MEFESAGNKIRSMRLRAGLSQKELAETTQLSLRTIQRIENSATEPRGDSLKRISEALGVTVEELLPVRQTGTLVSAQSKNVLLEDKWVSLVLRLSPLTYLINPLLAVLAPIIIWKLFENKFTGVNSIARKIIEVQLTWLIILGLLYGYMYCASLFHWWVPFNNTNMFIVLPILLFYLNAVFIIIEVIVWITGKKHKSLKYL